MKRIIGLYRRSNVGKTETLNLLIDLLQAATTGTPMPTPQPEGKDRRECFNYKGLKIGVCTGGDDEDVLQENCDFFDSHDCDIAFSATRTKGKTVYKASEYAEKHGTKVEWIRKNVVEKDFSIANLDQAKGLFKMI